MALPLDGQTNWGNILNDQIAADELAAAIVSASLSAHEGNVPSDPHGDRAFAAQLVAPLTTGVNNANGYVTLDNTGHLPAGLLPPGGALTNWFDVQNNAFGATGLGTVDDAPAINAALAAAGTAGGGVVWVPDGLYGIGSPLYIQSGTTLLLSQGATIQRISPIAAPLVMLQNYTPGVSASTGKFWVLGGTWDAIGTTSQNSNCTIFSFVNATGVVIRDVTLNNPGTGQAAFGKFYGSSNIFIENIVTTGTRTVNRASTIVCMFQLEQTNNTNILGLVSGDYASQMCNNVNLMNVSHQATTSSDSQGTFTNWDAFLGTEGTISSSSLFHTNIQVNQSDATGLAANGILALNWNQVTYDDCFSNAPNEFTQGWVSSPPASVVWNAQDNWHPLTPGNSWSNNGANLQYKFVGPNQVAIIGDLNSGTVTNGTNIATLPVGYRPANTQAIPVVFRSGSGTVTATNPHISVGSGGGLAVEGMTGLNGGSEVNFYRVIDLIA